MKSLVYFKPSSSSVPFEGVRLRKNLKGALELSSLSWVDSIYANPEVVHLLSPDDESLVKSFREEGAKIVVSAFSTENDPEARFLDKNTEGGFALRKVAIKLLTEADLVLVPNVFCEDFISRNSIRSANWCVRFVELFLMWQLILEQIPRPMASGMGLLFLLRIRYSF